MIFFFVQVVVSALSEITNQLSEIAVMTAINVRRTMWVFHPSIFSTVDLLGIQRWNRFISLSRACAVSHSLPEKFLFRKYIYYNDVWSLPRAINIIYDTLKNITFRYVWRRSVHKVYSIHTIFWKRNSLHCIYCFCKKYILIIYRELSTDVNGNMKK